MILVELLCRLARLLGCGVREAALGCVRIMGSEGEGEALKSALGRNYSFSVCTRAFSTKSCLNQRSKGHQVLTMIDKMPPFLTIGCYLMPHPCLLCLCHLHPPSHRGILQRLPFPSDPSQMLPQLEPGQASPRNWPCPVAQCVLQEEKLGEEGWEGYREEKLSMFLS